MIQSPVLPSCSVRTFVIASDVLLIIVLRIWHVAYGFTKTKSGTAWCVVQLIFLPVIYRPAFCVFAIPSLIFRVPQFQRMIRQFHLLWFHRIIGLYLSNRCRLCSLGGDVLTLCHDKQQATDVHQPRPFNASNGHGMTLLTACTYILHELGTWNGYTVM